MSQEVFSAISTIVSLVCLVSVMVEFKTSPRRSLVILSIGSVLTFVLTALVLRLVQPSHHGLAFLILVLFPIGLMFDQMVMIRGFRYVYTFVLSISITFFINTVSILMMAHSASLWIGFLFGSILLTAFCTLFFLKYRPLYHQVQRQKTKDWAAFSITPILCLILLIFLSGGSVSAWFTMDHFEAKVLVFAILAITHVMICLNIQKYAHLTTVEKNNRLLKAMVHDMRNQLNAKIEEIRITRLYRHDLHHHLCVLSVCAHHQNLTDFDAYVQKIEDRLDETAIVDYSLNFSINAVLSVYFKKAQMWQIKIRHTISLPEIIPVEDIDLSVILANAIENAINANAKIIDPDQRYLDLQLIHDHNTLTMVLENPVTKIPLFKDGLPISEDQDHGYGTLGIRSLADRYQGSAYFSAKKGRFTMIVQIPLTL